MTANYSFVGGSGEPPFYFDVRRPFEGDRHRFRVNPGRVKNTGPIVFHELIEDQIQFSRFYNPSSTHTPEPYQPFTPTWWQNFPIATHVISQPKVYSAASVCVYEDMPLGTHEWAHIAYVQEIFEKHQTCSFPSGYPLYHHVPIVVFGRLYIGDADYYLFTLLEDFDRLCAYLAQQSYMASTPGASLQRNKLEFVPSPLSSVYDRAATADTLSTLALQKEYFPGTIQVQSGAATSFAQAAAFVLEPCEDGMPLQAHFQTTATDLIADAISDLFILKANARDIFSQAISAFENNNNDAKYVAQGATYEDRQLFKALMAQLSWDERHPEQSFNLRGKIMNTYNPQFVAIDPQSHEREANRRIVFDAINAGTQIGTRQFLNFANGAQQVDTVFSPTQCFVDHQGNPVSVLGTLSYQGQIVNQQFQMPFTDYGRVILDAYRQRQVTHPTNQPMAGITQAPATSARLDVHDSTNLPSGLASLEEQLISPSLPVKKPVAINPANDIDDLERLLIGTPPKAPPVTAQYARAVVEKAVDDAEEFFADSVPMFPFKLVPREAGENYVPVDVSDAFLEQVQGVFKCQMPNGMYYMAYGTPRGFDRRAPMILLCPPGQEPDRSVGGLYWTVCRQIYNNRVRAETGASMRQNEVASPAITEIAAPPARQSAPIPVATVAKVTEMGAPARALDIPLTVSDLLGVTAPPAEAAKPALKPEKPAYIAVDRSLEAELFQRINAGTWAIGGMLVDISKEASRPGIRLTGGLTKYGDDDFTILNTDWNALPTRSESGDSDVWVKFVRKLTPVELDKTVSLAEFFHHFNNFRLSHWYLPISRPDQRMMALYAFQHSRNGHGVSSSLYPHVSREITERYGHETYLGPVRGFAIPRTPQHPLTLERLALGVLLSALDQDSHEIITKAKKRHDIKIEIPGFTQAAADLIEYVRNRLSLPTEVDPTNKVKTVIEAYNDDGARAHVNMRLVQHLATDHTGAKLLIGYLESLDVDMSMLRAATQSETDIDAVEALINLGMIDIADYESELQSRAEQWSDGVDERIKNELDRLAATLPKPAKKKEVEFKLRRRKQFIPSAFFKPKDLTAKEQVALDQIGIELTMDGSLPEWMPALDETQTINGVPLADVEDLDAISVESDIEVTAPVPPASEFVTVNPLGEQLNLDPIVATVGAMDYIYKDEGAVESVLDELTEVSSVSISDVYDKLTALRQQSELTVAVDTVDYLLTRLTNCALRSDAGVDDRIMSFMDDAIALDNELKEQDLQSHQVFTDAWSVNFQIFVKEYKESRQAKIEQLARTLVTADDVDLEELSPGFSAFSIRHLNIRLGVTSRTLGVNILDDVGVAISEQQDKPAVLENLLTAVSFWYFSQPYTLRCRITLADDRQYWLNKDMYGTWRMSLIV